MGVITKILYRNNILNKPRHRNLFLDMEENIHIHYRDLRIEMSRAEFEEFAVTFSNQSKELLKIIHDKNYQDGKLSNSNQDDVRIWTESRLKHEVKYHPRRFSIEECGDGYHLHYRNFKFLIDPEEFKQIAQSFKNIDIEGSYAETYDEVLELLHANDIDFMLDADNKQGETLSILVARYHLPKVRDIFDYIGFAKETQGIERHYIGSKLKVVVKTDKQRSADDYKYIRSHSRAERLADYLVTTRSNIDPDELNRIKCQVLDLYYALAANKTLHVETDPQLWLYAAATSQIIFPYKSTPVTGRKDAVNLYNAWSSQLARLELSFIKPTKIPFSEPEQKSLKKKVDAFLKKEVASFAAVDKIFIMGSSMRGDMGLYQAPFVHGKMVKLGSDVDILVEISPHLEADVPDHWRHISPTSSSYCAVYHVGQIPLINDISEWQAIYPNIDFTHHLVDAYVFFPSQGHPAEKDAFLKKFGAKCFYDRSRDGIIHQGEVEEKIANIIADQYALQRIVVEKMSVSTENALFKIFTVDKCFILKLFKVSGNYNRSRVAEHVLYEEHLVNQLKSRDISTAGVLPSREANLTIEGFPALLFERIPGKVQQRPEYPLDSIGAALARIHLVQMEKPLDLPIDFTFDDICMIWLPQYSVFPKSPVISRDILEAFEKLMPLVDRYNPGENRNAMYDNSPFIHCHGDVTPKNVIVSEQGEAVFFDFNNAFYGPRMVDVIDGAFEFSLAEKYIHLADFSRFDAFIKHYTGHAPLSPEEQKDLPRWTELVGLIKFVKEVRVMLERPKEELRRRRALAIAEFILSQLEKPSSTT